MTTATYEQAGLTYDDLTILYDGMPAARELSILAGSLTAAEDLTDAVKWDTFRAEENANTGRGTISMRFERTLAQLPTVTDQRLIRVFDHATNTETHRGIIRARKPSSVPGYSAVEVIADDMGSLLDDTFVFGSDNATDTMLTRITFFWNKYGNTQVNLLSPDLSFVEDIAGTLPAQSLEFMTLRQAIERIISQVSGNVEYYVDALGRLHVFSAEANDAPFDIDADAPGVGEIAPHDLSIEYDSSAYKNQVFVQGATREASNYFNDDAAIAAHDGMVRCGHIMAPDCDTQAMAQSLANMYLGRVAEATPRGAFSTTSPNDGWRAGQNVTITSADLDLTAEVFRIPRVTTTIVRPGDTMLRRYSIEFGSPRAGT